MADEPTNEASTPPQHAEPALGKASTAAERAEERRRAKAEAAEAKLAKKAARQSRGPSVWKTYVVPALTLVVIGAIAASLVKLAFFPDEEPAPPAANPGFDLTDPTVTAQLGTVVNDLTIEGSVVQDVAQPVRATAAGTITELHAWPNAWLNAGDPMYTIRSETQPTTPSADGSMPAPVVRYVTVTAPTTGAVSSYPTLIGQQVQIGDELAQVQPYTYRIEATLTAEQQYRLLTLPTEAQVALRGGPAPFTCTGLEILQPATAPSTPNPNTAAQPTVSQATARCIVPADVRVFPGLTADMTIAGGTAENVLTLPVTAVQGSADTGVVYLPGVDGAEPEGIPVTLGLNDGTLIQITGGIDEGTEVLQFAPGQSAEVDPCAPETYDELLCTGSGEVMLP